VIVEASFTSAYGFIAPGTRWAMVMQFWVPALMLFVGALVAFGARAGRWIMFVAVLCGLTFISLLAFNRQLVLYTAAERQFFAQLKAVVSSTGRRSTQPPHYYVIRMDATTVLFMRNYVLSDMYARTLLPPGVHYRVILRGKPAEGPFGLVFHPDGMKGISLDEPWVSYDRLSFLSWDGHGMLPIDNTPAAWRGYEVKWVK
jgi:hypothetical protein